VGSSPVTWPDTASQEELKDALNIVQPAWFVPVATAAEYTAHVHHARLAERWASRSDHSPHLRRRRTCSLMERTDVKAAPQCDHGHGGGGGQLPSGFLRRLAISATWPWACPARPRNLDEEGWWW